MNFRIKRVNSVKLSFIIMITMTFVLAQSTFAGSPLDVLLGISNDEADTVEEQEQTVLDEFAGQIYTQGKNAVLEYLLAEALNDTNVENISDTDGLIIYSDSFEIPGNGQTVSFSLDMTQIPESLDGIDEIQLSLPQVKGMAASQALELHFTLESKQKIVKLHPFVHQEAALIEFLESIPGVFKVTIENGWMFVVVNDGQSLSLYFDFVHKSVSEFGSSESGITFENPVAHEYESNDVNGDGVQDYMVVQGDTAQLMLMKGHSVADSAKTITIFSSISGDEVVVNTNGDIAQLAQQEKITIDYPSGPVTYEKLSASNF